MTVHNKEYSLFQNSLGKTLYIKKDDCNLQESRIGKPWGGREFDF